jgi:hypothetical protein
MLLRPLLQQKIIEDQTFRKAIDLVTAIGSILVSKKNESKSKKIDSARIN